MVVVDQYDGERVPSRYEGADQGIVDQPLGEADIGHDGVIERRRVEGTGVDDDVVVSFAGQGSAVEVRERQPEVGHSHAQDHRMPWRDEHGGTAEWQGVLITWRTNNVASPVPPTISSRGSSGEDG